MLTMEEKIEKVLEILKEFGFTEIEKNHDKFNLDMLKHARRALEKKMPSGDVVVTVAVRTGGDSLGREIWIYKNARMFAGTYSVIYEKNTAELEASAFLTFCIEKWMKSSP